MVTQTSLAATVVPTLTCAIPVIPLASIADFARYHGRLGNTPEETHREHAALDAVHHVVSPLHREPLLDPTQILIVAAANDRITPIAHAERLGRHFRTPVSTGTVGIYCSSDDVVSFAPWAAS